MAENFKSLKAHEASILLLPSKFLSMIIPRYLGFSTHLISEPLSSSVLGSSGFCVLNGCAMIINSIFGE